MIVWVGLLAGATPKLITEIRVLAEELSRWLESSATTLLATHESRRRVSEARGRVAEMTAVAHDARAPLASLSYLLSDLTQTHPFLADDARKIQAEISYINGLIEGFSPGAQERSSGKAARCDVVTAVRRVGGRFARQALDAGISFSWELPYGDASAVIDSLSLERALTNIVGNAIKHSGSRDVRFEVACEDNFVIARVVDSGVGIPRAVLERIALTDSAADVAFDSIRAAAGWGVGLLSSKSLVERSGGVFRVTSVEGRTCVEIVMPSAEKAVAKESYEGTRAVASKPPPAYGAVDIIVIDDDIEHSESLTRILQRAGLVTRSFSSVDAAHEFVTENPSIKIVCDAHMPDGGAERMLKALRGLHGARSLAVMSGEADDESLYRFAALGASEFFAKPIDADRLRGWIAHDGGGERVSAADSGWGSKRRFSA
jgi:CheY-like chemotaxis protein/anti-sigma regulatory factor (Ser/Thr protein kinase)